ncbi:hypothetical protein E4U59_002148 [Claviceps monticola]|nr:hypothetical protein E4U59_002148 [Claviceps monticola]
MADVPTTGRDEAPAQVASYWGRKATLSGGNQGVSGTDPFYGVIMATVEQSAPRKRLGSPALVSA